MEAGGPERDLSSYSKWRDEVEPEVEEAFDFYALYLSGQTSGLSDALDLVAVKAALEIDDVPRADWQAVAQRSFLIHSELMPILRREAKARG